MAPGDRIVLYLTQVIAFAASMRLTGALYEDRTTVWPGKPGNPDPYPWRFASEPELVLDEERGCRPRRVKDELEHIRKWPPEHWKLAFQGQLRTVSEPTRTLLDAMAARSERRRAVSVPARCARCRRSPADRRRGAALVLSLFLPWYEKSYFSTGGSRWRTRGRRFQVFSFVEAAMLLVAPAVFLVWARAQHQAFHLPGGDGIVVSRRGRLGAAR